MYVHKPKEQSTNFQEVPLRLHFIFYQVQTDYKDGTLLFFPMQNFKTPDFSPPCHTNTMHWGTKLGRALSAEP